MKLNLQLFKYDPNKDYSTAINDAINRGASASEVKQLQNERNEKIAASGGSLDKWKDTSDYGNINTAASNYISGGSSSSGSSGSSNKANGGTQNTIGNSDYYLYGKDGVKYDDNGNIDFSATFSNMFANGASVDDLEKLVIARQAKAAGNSNYADWLDYDNTQANMERTIQMLRDNENQKKDMEALQDYLNDIEDQQDKINSYKYDLANDPLYEIYKNIFTREGQNAQADTLADVSALTGGLPSSYAVTASQQALGNYMQKIADIVPQLEQAAYDKFVNNNSMNMDLLDRVASAIDTQYQRYRDQVSDSYNWNRAKTSDYQFKENFDYNKESDARAYEQWLAEFDEKKRQALVDEAIAKGQLSVSQGNLALSRAKFAYEQEQEQDAKSGSGNDYDTNYELGYRDVINGDLTYDELISNESAYVDAMGDKNYNKLLDKAKGLNTGGYNF